MRCAAPACPPARSTAPAVEEGPESRPPPGARSGRRWRASRTIRSGKPCQDAQAFAVHPAGALLVAVADGAGSAERSDEGAQAAVPQRWPPCAPAPTARCPTARRTRKTCCATPSPRRAPPSLAWRTSRRRAARFACTLTCAVTPRTAGWRSARWAMARWSPRTRRGAVCRHAPAARRVCQRDPLPHPGRCARPADGRCRQPAGARPGGDERRADPPGAQAAGPGTARAVLPPLFRFAGQVSDPDAAAQLAAFSILSGSTRAPTMINRWCWRCAPARAPWKRMANDLYDAQRRGSSWARASGAAAKPRFTSWRASLTGWRKSTTMSCAPTTPAS
jgi:hypothetical protein